MKPSKRNIRNAKLKAEKYGGRPPEFSKYAKKTGKGVTPDQVQPGKAAGVQVTGKA